MSKSNAPALHEHRDRQRARGLRCVRLWGPDTQAPGFAVQVAHDIAVCARLAPEDEVMLDGFERIAAEDLEAWN